MELTFERDEFSCMHYRYYKGLQADEIPYLFSQTFSSMRKGTPLSA